MAEPRRQYPFALRVLFFALIYMVLAIALEYPVTHYKGIPYEMTLEKVQRYFLIGICIAAAALLFFRFRNRNIPK